MKRARQVFGEKEFNFIPLSYVLPSEKSSFLTDFQKEKQTLARNSKPSEKEFNSKALWIVKPVNLSRGRGIHLITSPAEISAEDFPCVVCK